MHRILIVLLLGLFSISCLDDEIEKKGFQVNEITEDESGQKIVGLQIDSLQLEIQPKEVLLTFNAEHRLTPIYKVNYDKKTKRPWTGAVAHHTSWNYNTEDGNDWNGHFMPGFEIVYGYNFVNVSHYNNATKRENKLFLNEVLCVLVMFCGFNTKFSNSFVWDMVIRNFGFRKSEAYFNDSRYKKKKESTEEDADHVINTAAKLILYDIRTQKYNCDSYPTDDDVSIFEKRWTYSPGRERAPGCQIGL